LRPDNLRTLQKTLDNSGIMPSEKTLDLKESQMIPSDFGLSLWVNEYGRFAQGKVSPNEKETLLAELSRFLLADRDKVTNEPIIANTYQGDALYQGPFTSLKPDLVIEYNNFYRPQVDNKKQNPHVEGGHTLDGIFLAYGEPIKATEIHEASLIDLAPTILHLLGQPIPPDMGGRVLIAALTTDYEAAHPIQKSSEPAQWQNGRQQQSPSLTALEKEELDEQLRQLGYIE
jgi:predicted AlkP superfamily phosphohydrolase/phosphomutase